MKLAHIAAASENDVIGTEGKLPWDIPEDMKFFRDTTKGHIIIMGRKTFESMDKPLPNRLNIVITRQPNYMVPNGVIVVPDLKTAYEKARPETAKWGDLVFVIGGGEIYSQSLQDMDLVYLTRVHREVAGDAKYPRLTPNFKEVDRKERDGYTFLTYEKR